MTTYGYFSDSIKSVRTPLPAIPNVAVYVYLHGTTTLATLYNYDLGAEISNPLVSNATGDVFCWLLPGAYDFYYVVNGFQEIWRRNVLISTSTINAIRTVIDNTSLMYPADVILLCDCTSKAIAVSLPLVSSIPAGYQVGIKKIDSTGNIVTITDTEARTINGSASQTLEVINEGIWVAHDGTSWQIVGRM